MSPSRRDLHQFHHKPFLLHRYFLLFPLPCTAGAFQSCVLDFHHRRPLLLLLSSRHNRGSGGMGVLCCFSTSASSSSSSFFITIIMIIRREREGQGVRQRVEDRHEFLQRTAPFGCFGGRRVTRVGIGFVVEAGEEGGAFGDELGALEGFRDSMPGVREKAGARWVWIWYGRRRPYGWAIVGLMDERMDVGEIKLWSWGFPLLESLLSLWRRLNVQNGWCVIIDLANQIIESP